MTEKQHNCFQRCVLGYRANSTSGSNRRRAFFRCANFVCAYLVVEAILHDTGIDWLALTVAAAWAIVALSVVLFVLTIATILRLAGLNVRPNPQRLILNTLTSLTLNVLAFSLLYRFLEITETASGAPPVSALDHIYFSAVTFSTLGFGDFSPTPGARPFAALQAIMGNLHLGLIVGAMFYAIQPRGSVGNDVDDDTADDD